MDENGDAEGNYTLIARKTLANKENEYGLFPVGVFALRRTDSRLPVSNLHNSFALSAIPGGERLITSQGCLADCFFIGAICFTAQNYWNSFYLDCYINGTWNRVYLEKSLTNFDGFVTLLKKWKEDFTPEMFYKVEEAKCLLRNKIPFNNSW